MIEAPLLFINLCSDILKSSTENYFLKKSRKDRVFILYESDMCSVHDSGQSRG